ncbi:MAG: metallophosphoesterase [Sphingomonas sp.]|uniref:metallophosphoesterase family protein n=1 Tax=Sphingomonas sp. TaxID=28214 RepID=UPI001AC398F1|nr:metallophosphoesterase [Sphingomonas sp.]MBN8808431.1 metallophosphoesterase [Sphingomonas sp.]
MSDTICWTHIGDLHLDEADDWAGLTRLKTAVDQINHAAEGIDFVFLPGDNANHGTVEQYERLIEALAPLERPWRIIPGDHDFEPGDLGNYNAAIPAENRPEAETIAGFRCLFLDIISPGAGGPDFRVTMHHRNRLAEELSRAEAAGQVPLVFMHAYPGDLAADGDTIARAFADARVAFVDTGHTHYNELLNDGRVIYGATRSTAQIEEDDGRPGFAIVCVHGRVPSWRFRRLDAPWPHVQIVSPCDVRLVTRPADTHQVPRPGMVTIIARVLGATGAAILEARVDGTAPVPMTCGSDGLWRVEVRVDGAGIHGIEVTCGDGRDRIDILVRDAKNIPKRRLLAGAGTEAHSIGAWPIAGIDGFQLGPNKNGGPPDA